MPLNTDTARRLAGFLALALLAGLTACAPGQDDPGPSAGRLDAGSYLAVGDGYSAGYADGGLTRTGQATAYPALLARQLRRAGAAATFPQALLAEGSPAAYAAPVCGGPQTTPVFGPRAGALPQDLTVPGLRLADIQAVGYGNAGRAGFNPYFERLLPAPNAPTTYLQAVTAAAPAATFFTYFVGLDDFLPFVRSGGTCGTLPANLNAQAKKLLDVLAANGRRGVVAQLPNLASLPLLRSAPELQIQLQAGGDTARLYVYNSAFAKAEPATDQDYVLAPAVARIGRLTPVTVNGQVLQLRYGRDSRAPLADADVLDRLEYDDANQLVARHNVYLNLLARDTYRLPALDLGIKASALRVEEAVFNKINAGLSIGGVLYATAPGGASLFAADLTSLTPRGNGLLANAFIQALNTAYKANIPLVDINALPATAQ